jgi:EpsI family protein
MKSLFPPERQPLLSRRELVSGLLMLSAAGVAAARRPDVPLNYLGNHKLDDVIPVRIGRWNFVANSGVVVPPTDQMQLTLYSQQLTRVYSDGSDANVMLLMAYSANQTGFLQVHRPEFCYTAAGYSLSDFRLRNVPLSPTESFRANTLDATRDGQIERLLYWTRIGNRIPPSWVQQKLAVAEQNLERIIPDAVLVRVSIVTPDEERAMRTMDEFVRTMIASIAPPLRRVFIV